jgi:hypothetical protein
METVRVHGGVKMYDDAAAAARHYVEPESHRRDRACDPSGPPATVNPRNQPPEGG